MHPLLLAGLGGLAFTGGSKLMGALWPEEQPRGTRRPAARGTLAGRGAIGRRGIGAGLQEATTTEFTSVLDEAYTGEVTAARAAINRQLAEALRRTDILYGGRGVYRSGELAGEHRRLEESALRSVAQATGALGLERAGLGLQERQLEQAGMLGQAQLGIQETQLALQEAQMRQAGETASAQMWTQFGAAAIDPFLEYALPAIMSLFGGGGTPSLTTSPGLTTEWSGLRGGY